MSTNSQGVLLIVRYNVNDFRSYRNSIKRGKSILRNYNGSEAGLCPEVIGVENYCHSYSYGMMHFPSLRDATFWYQSEPTVRQQDWLSGVDIILVPTANAPSGERPAFEVQDLVPGEDTSYLESLSGDYLASIGEWDALNLSASSNVEVFRGLWNPAFIVVNQWPSLQACNDWYNSDKGKGYVQMRHNSTSGSVFVTENRDIISPPPSPRE